MTGKFKAGQRVKVVSNTHADGHSSLDQSVVGRVGTVRRVEGPYYRVKLDGENRLYDPMLSERDLMLAEKTLDNLEVGDVLLYSDGEREREIVAVGPEYVATLDKYDGSNDERVYSIAYLKSEGYAVEQPGTPIELTIEEIADKFKINVSDLRIKKED